MRLFAEVVARPRRVGTAMTASRCAAGHRRRVRFVSTPGAQRKFIGAPRCAARAATAGHRTPGNHRCAQLLLVGQASLFWRTQQSRWLQKLQRSGCAD